MDGFDCAGCASTCPNYCSSLRLEGSKNLGFCVLLNLGEGASTSHGPRKLYIMNECIARGFIDAAWTEYMVPALRRDRQQNCRGYEALTSFASNPEVPIISKSNDYFQRPMRQ